MNRLILCEGKTDAILLSYYLENIAGWKHTNAPKNLAIKAKEKNENVDWYKKNDEKLMICAVGGKDNFTSFFNRDIREVMKNSTAFSRIVLITDRDDREIKDIENKVSSELAPYFQTVENRKWQINEYIDAFKMTKNVETMLLVIPKEHEGALESVMLSAISEDEYDLNIVNKCCDFVSKIRLDASKYISSYRLELKARLSTVWAIQSPEKAFDFIDEQIKNVEWGKYTTLHDCFGVLKDI